MPTVQNPPKLVPQETPSWCFAAAEVVVRAYRGLPAMSQYDIARRSTYALAQLDPDVEDAWNMAVAMDNSTGQGENGGANQASQLVQLIRTRWNAFDNGSTGGRFIQNLTADLVRGEIDNNRIFVIGNAIHYYVVYGYSDNGNTMMVRDSWPAGVGGLTATVTLANFLNQANHVVIFFA